MAFFLTVLLSQSHKKNAENEIDLFFFFPENREPGNPGFENRKTRPILSPAGGGNGKKHPCRPLFKWQSRGTSHDVISTLRYAMPSPLHAIWPVAALSHVNVEPCLPGTSYYLWLGQQTPSLHTAPTFGKLCDSLSHFLQPKLPTLLCRLCHQPKGRI